MRDIIVKSEDQIKDFTAQQDYILISVTSPGDRANILPSDNSLKAVLKLYFHDFDRVVNYADIDGNTHSSIIFNKAMACEVWNFVRMFPDILIVCQCEAGISRSPALAASLSKYFNDHDQYYFDNYMPNRLVYREMLNTKPT